MKRICVIAPTCLYEVSVSSVVFACVESFANEYDPDLANTPDRVFVTGRWLGGNQYMIGNGLDVMEIDLDGGGV